MNEITLEQGTLEWFEARLGRVTASRVGDVVAKTQKGWGAARYNYLGEIIAQRLTGQVQEGFLSKPMAWGIDNEPEARDAYEFFSGLPVTRVGFIPHPSIEMAGASPDGLVGDRGLLEIKCPNTSTHIDTLLGEKIPDKYFYQMQFQMACAGREWCDYVSYDPRLPEELKLFVQRYEREDHQIEKLNSAVVEFLTEIDDKIAQLQALNLALPAREAVYA